MKHSDEGLYARPEGVCHTINSDIQISLCHDAQAVAVNNVTTF